MAAATDPIYTPWYPAAIHRQIGKRKINEIREKHNLGKTRAVDRRTDRSATG